MTRDEAIAHALEQLNQPPQQRYSGPEAIARRDEMLRARSQCVMPPIKYHESTGEYVMTEKDLGT